MAISIQMDASKGIEEIVSGILNFNLLDQTLEQHLAPIQNISARATALRKLINENNYPIIELMPLTNYLLIHSATDSNIALPYEIFEISTISLGKKIIAPELACYFKELVSCNIKYAEIVSLIMRNNQIRDLVINQPISTEEAGMATKGTDEELYKYLMVVAVMFTLALSLKEMVSKYRDKADTAFLKTTHYIELLGISEPIKAARDADGKLIFNKV